MTKLALLIAPDYDGVSVPRVPGSESIIDRAASILAAHGGYSIRSLQGYVSRADINREVTTICAAGGSVLVLFYGHGLLRGTGRCILATSDGQPFDEGIPAEGLVGDIFTSRAREAIVILDCCHAGATHPAAARDIAVRDDIGTGRALFAACSESQQAWADPEIASRPGGLFSHLLLDGLAGAAATLGKVRASALIDYVGNHLTQWGQSPLLITSEGGDCLCIITEGFERNSDCSGRLAERQSTKPALKLGLPFRPSSSFVGREAEIDRLISLIASGGRVSISATVEGIGGIGKTELIIQLLNRREVDDNFDVVLWLDAAGPIVPQIQQLARALGGDLRDVPEQMIAGRLAALLQPSGRTLIVLDNAQDWEPVRHLLPTQASLLVTTRTQRFGGTQFAHVELEGLTPSAARSLLIELAPDIQSDPDLGELIDQLCGHALAIELAGATIRYKDIAVREYLDDRGRVTPVSAAILRQLRYGKTVEQSIASTWESLSSNEARYLWRRASLFAPTIATKELLRASFCGDERNDDLLYYLDDGDLTLFHDLSSFDDAYVELKDRNVFTRVQGTNGGQWSMHRLIREFGRERVDSKEYVAHTFALSQWLERSQISDELAAPHLIAAILDGGKFGADVYNRRFYQREIFHRGRLFSSRDIIYYLRDKMHDPIVLKTLFEGLTDVNDDVRAEAVRMLSEVSDIEEVQAGIAAALADASSVVRNIAARALLEHSGTSTVSILQRVLSSENPIARLEAAQVLSSLDAPGASTALVVGLGDEDQEVVEEAAIGLGGHGDPQAVPILERLVNTLPLGNRYVRSIRALFSVAPELGAAALTQAVANEDPGRLRAIAGALCLKIGEGPALIENEAVLGRIQPAVMKLMRKGNFLKRAVTWSEHGDRRGFYRRVRPLGVDIGPSCLMELIFRVSRFGGFPISRKACELVEADIDRFGMTLVRNMTPDNCANARAVLVAMLSTGKQMPFKQEILSACDLFPDLTADEVQRFVHAGLDSKDEGTRLTAIALVAKFGVLKLEARLRKILEKPDQSDEIYKEARRALEKMRPASS